MSRFFLKLSLFFSALLPMVCLATEQANSVAQPVDPLSVSSIVNMLMGLGLVLAIIFLMAWLVRRMGGMQVLGSQKIQMLGGLSLGAREKIVLVQVENKRLVVGVAQGQVNTLHVLDGEFETETVAEAASPFKDKLLQALQQNIQKKTDQKNG